MVAVAFGFDGFIDPVTVRRLIGVPISVGAHGVWAGAGRRGRRRGRGGRGGSAGGRGGRAGAAGRRGPGGPVAVTAFVTSCDCLSGERPRCRTPWG